MAFAELGEETEPIQKRRWIIEMKNSDGEVSTKPYDENKLNIVNTSLEGSDIVRLICGEEL